MPRWVDAEAVATSEHVKWATDQGWVFFFVCSLQLQRKWHLIKEHALKMEQTPTTTSTSPLTTKPQGANFHYNANEQKKSLLMRFQRLHDVNSSVMY